jgi:hypothetical protein
MEAKKLIASIAVGALLLGAGALGGANLFPKEIVKEVTVTKEVPVPGPVEIKTETVPGPTVYQNVTVEVPVDNGNLATVMTYIHDNVDADITESYIIFETDAQIEALSYVRENLNSVLDDENYFKDGAALGDYRKSEVSIKHISDAVVSDQNFDKKDVLLTYDVRVKAKKGSNDAEYFDFKVEVPYENGVLVDSDVTADLQ